MTSRMITFDCQPSKDRALRCAVLCDLHNSNNTSSNDHCTNSSLNTSARGEMFTWTIENCCADVDSIPIRKDSSLGANETLWNDTPLGPPNNKWKEECIPSGCRFAATTRRRGVAVLSLLEALFLLLPRLPTFTAAHDDDVVAVDQTI